MLQSLKQLYKHTLGALDGEIGHVKDFYFDDQSWTIRYVVADTGSWLPGRQVLLSPHLFGALHLSQKSLDIKLKRKQIEDCPPIDSHKPVSRQYEEEYFRHYGLPTYWQDEGLSLNNLPPVESPTKESVFEKASANLMKTNSADARLRSAQAVTGYNFQASDGVIGHVVDFIMDDQSWVIGALVIKIGHRLSGTEVTILTPQIDRISYEESTVHVNSNKDAVERSPVYLPID